MSDALFRRKQLWKQAEAEAEMVMAINEIACKYNCKIHCINFKKQVIAFYGNSENEMDCAMAIGLYIGQKTGEEYDGTAV